MHSPELRFYYDLADKKNMLVGEMLRKISSRELTEWVAYYRIKAVEQEQDDRNRENRQSIRE
jgi:hypothetical protein